MRILSALVVLVVLTGCDSSKFSETPRLDEIKTLTEADPDPDWNLSLLKKHAEANLLVHVELCGDNGAAIHEAAMEKHRAIEGAEARAIWLREYVETIIMIERQQRYNLLSGSISSKSAVCTKVKDAYKDWRESGALPSRRFSA